MENKNVKKATNPMSDAKFPAKTRYLSDEVVAMMWVKLQVRRSVSSVASVMIGAAIMKNILLVLSDGPMWSLHCKIPERTKLGSIISHQCLFRCTIFKQVDL